MRSHDQRHQCAQFLYGFLWFGEVLPKGTELKEGPTPPDGTVGKLGSSWEIIEKKA